MVKHGLLLCLCLLLPLSLAGPARAETFTGTCEDLFVPGYPHPEASGTAFDDISLIPDATFRKAIADCRKRGEGLGADPKAAMALTRMRALNGDRTTLPALTAAARKGTIEASFLIFAVYNTSPPVSPAADTYEELPRALAERELRKAADAGMLPAMAFLSRGLMHGALARRDEKEARVWLERMMQLAERRKKPAIRAGAALDLAVLFQDDPASTAAELARLPELAGIAADLPSGRDYADWLRLRGRRTGLGWDKNPADALALAETLNDKNRNPALLSEVLLAMVARGDAKDRDRVATLLESATPRQSWSFDKLVGEMLADGKPAGRDLRRAFAFLATPASRSHEEAIRYARLVALSGRGVKVPPDVLRRLYEAVDLDIPGATDAAVRLLESSNSDARDALSASLLAIRYARSRPDIQLYLLDRAAQFGPQPQYAPFDTKERAAAELDRRAGEGLPAAMRIKAVALGKGSLYRQDDVAAAELMLKAAEAGDAEAMRLIADAYGSGKGVARDRAMELQWTKAAARTGLPDAQRDLVREIPFRGPSDDFSLHDAIVTGLMLYGDSRDAIIPSTGLESAFLSITLDRWGTDYIAAAVMDGVRAAMPLRDDATMAKIFADVPKDVILAIEGVLQRDGYLQTAPDGFMRPEARTALAAWARAKGFPAMEADAPKTPPAADARLAGVTPVAADRIAAIRERTFSQLTSATGDKERKDAIERLALLAEYGDLQARAEILKTYPQSAALKRRVVMGLVILYGLDVLASAPAGSNDGKMDFLFAGNDIASYGAANVAADVILITLRDDPRLREPPLFNRIADNFIFIGGLCDALGERAKANNVPGLEADACSASSRRALIQWAAGRGPDGSEALVRRQAAEALAKLNP